jgi:hypothetical protein
MLSGSRCGLGFDRRPASVARKLAMAVIILTFVEAVGGSEITFFYSPLMDADHTSFIADLLWIVVVLLAAEAIAFEPAHASADSRAANYSPGVRPAASSSSAPANR